MVGGAPIALEIARQLRDRHTREVNLLVSFDGPLFNTGAGISSWNPLYWYKIGRNLPSFIHHELMKTPSAGLLAQRVLKRVKGIAQGCAAESVIDISPFPPGQQAFINAFYEAARRYIPAEYPHSEGDPGPVAVYETKRGLGYRLLQVGAE